MRPSKARAPAAGQADGSRPGCYGDIYPITGIGKLLAAGVAVLGIGMFALPTGIVGAAFVEEIQGAKRKSAICPFCGKEIHGHRETGWGESLRRDDGTLNPG